MNQHELMHTVERILEDAKTGVLATLDTEGHPHMRWMTPAVIKGRPDVLFAVTSLDFNKVTQLEAHPEAEWMIQTRALDQVVNLRGRINILNNPAIRAEVMEQLAKKLTVFWKVTKGKTDFIILETILEEATFFQPMQGYRETVRFK